MSNQEGGGFGPGRTLASTPGYQEEQVPSAGMPIPPTTVRDPEAAPVPPPYGAPPPYAAPSPYAVPPYGAPPPPPYGAPPPYGGSDFTGPQPFGVPPPPPRTQSRRRTGSAALVPIAMVACVLISGAALAVAFASRRTGDDKPEPTIEVPAASSVPPDPGPAGPASSADPPADSDQPPDQPPPPRHRRGPKHGRPRGRPGSMPRPQGQY
jgi:hypothetical protein